MGLEYDLYKWWLMAGEDGENQEPLHQERTGGMHKHMEKQTAC